MKLEDKVAEAPPESDKNTKIELLEKNKKITLVLKGTNSQIIGVPHNRGNRRKYMMKKHYKNMSHI